MEMLARLRAKRRIPPSSGRGAFNDVLWRFPVKHGVRRILILVGAFVPVNSYSAQGTDYGATQIPSLRSMILNHPQIPGMIKTEILRQSFRFDYDIPDIPASWFYLVWQEETEEALRTPHSEPAYLKEISKLLDSRLTSIILRKEVNLETKAELTLHAYCLLLSMHGYYSFAASSTCHASRGVAKNAVVSVSLFTAAEAARSAAYSAVGTSAGTAALRATRTGAFNSIYDATRCAARDAFAAALSEDAPCKPVGWPSYLSAEKAVLLYFLSNFEMIFHETYNAAYRRLTDLPAWNIFESKESWEAFRHQHFGSLRKDVIHYLQAWLHQLVGSQVELLNCDWASLTFLPSLRGYRDTRLFP